MSKSKPSIAELFDPVYAFIDREAYKECVEYITKVQPLILRFELGQALLAYALVSSGAKQEGLDVAK
jgi:hypothetical protein